MSYIPDFQPNNGTEKKEVPVRYESVVSGTPTRAKSSKIKRAFLSFILPEDVPTLSDYVSQQAEKTLKNIVFPKLCDIIIDSLSMLLLNDSKGSKSSSVIPRVSYNTTNYNAVSRNNLPKSNAEANRQASFYEDLIYDSINDAEALRIAVEDAFYAQGYVSVLQLYSFGGYGRYTTPQQENYGWTTITEMKVEPTFDGHYILKMPYPVPLRR